MQEKPLRQHRILVVEDSQTSRLVAERYCKRLGYDSVAVVASGEEALEYLAKNPCDLALMDLEMPRMDGFEATRRIRRGEAGEQAGKLPIVAMSSHCQAGAMQRCLDAGMNGYLSKPLCLESMGQVLQTQFAAQDAGGQDGLNSQAASVGSRAGYASHSPHGSHGSLLDRQFALQRMGGDQEIFDELIQLFFEQYPLTLQELQQARADNDLKALGLQAHNLKNIYKTVGAESCGNICTAMEKAAIEQKPEEIETLLQLLQQETVQIVAMLRD